MTKISAEQVEKFLSTPQGVEWIEKRVAILMVNRSGRLAFEVYLGDGYEFAVHAIQAVQFGLHTEFIGCGESYLIGIVEALDSLKSEITSDNPEIFSVSRKQ